MADNNNPSTPATPSFHDLRAALGMPVPVESGQEPVVLTTSAPLEIVAPGVEAVKRPMAKTRSNILREQDPEAPAPTMVDPADAPEIVEVPAVGEPTRAEKRFSKLTSRAKEAEASNAALRAEIAALRSPAAPVAAAPVAAAAKPTAPNANTWTGTWDELEAARTQYAEDLSEYKVNEVLRKRDEGVKQAEARKVVETIHEAWVRRLDDATEANEDMEAAVAEVGTIVSKMGIQDVIKESEVGPEIVLHYFKDKDAMEKLSKMSMASAARAIGRVEAKLLEAKEAEAPASPAVPTTPAVATKKLPTPAKLVGGAATGSVKEFDPKSASMDSFKTWARKNLKAVAR